MEALAGATYLAGNTERVGIILCHAYTGTPADVNYLAHQLNALGYGVLCPLFDGHGTLDIQDILAAGPERWWYNLEQALDWMEARYPKLMVFGLSMGGVMAMKALCTQRPSLIAGGVFNSPVIRRGELALEERFMWYAEFLCKKRGEAEVFALTQADIRMKHQAQVADILAFTKAYVPQLSDITLPVYVAQSAQDELIDAEAVYDLLDALEQAQVDFHWFPDNTHVITVNKNREAFETSVKRFVENNQ